MIRIWCKRAGFAAALLILLLSPGWGSHVPFEQIDQHARNAPRQVTHDVEKLASYLAEPATNDVEKVRSFYVWITDNISYDVGAFRQYNPSRHQRVSPQAVLQKREAVCQGYAELFQAMCRLHDIPCHLIPGYSKGLNTNRQDFTRGDHAWNAVQIDNDWHLLDVTWGSGGLNDQLSFVKQFNDKYFLTNPKIFVQDHLPLDPVWQLLDCSISLASFANGRQTALEEEEEDSSTDCSGPWPSIHNIHGQEPQERKLAAAERAYAFNPSNMVVLIHAYMNHAHYLMNSIPQQLRSRAAIEEALVVQVEALAYLEKSEKVLSRTGRQELQTEKNMLKQNITNSRKNVAGLREALR